MTLSLSGCFGGGSTDAGAISTLPSENFGLFDNKTISIQYPVNWNLKTGSQIDTDMQDSIIAIMTSNFKDPFFTPVITIEQIGVSEEVSSVEFAEQTMKNNEIELINFNELERKDVTTYIGANPVNTKLTRFSGKSTLDDQVLEFLQIYLASGGVGYTVTAAYDPNDEENEATKLVQSLGTFSVK